MPCSASVGRAFDGLFCPDQLGSCRHVRPAVALFLKPGHRPPVFFPTAIYLSSILDTIRLRRRFGGRTVRNRCTSPRSLPLGYRLFGSTRSQTFTTSRDDATTATRSKGAYMCEADAKAAGDRAAKNEKNP